MSYWLFKSEPDDFSIDDLAGEASGRTVWDGIRNYQARNILRDQVAVGDQALFYHSRCKRIGVVGTMTVVKAGYPDPAQFDQHSKYFDPKARVENPRWFSVDVTFGEKFNTTIPLARIKQNPALSDMVLVNQGRLSIQPITPEQWQIVLGMRM